MESESLEVKEETPVESQTVIPGFDFISENDAMGTLQPEPPDTDPVAEIVSNLFSKEKKKGKPKAKAAPKPKAAKAKKWKAVVDADAALAESEATIRRSSRIKTLETRRGGQRRREVVFSGSSEILNRSFPNLAGEDESNSSSSCSIPFGMTPSISSPNLTNPSGPGFLGSPPRDSSGIPGGTGVTLSPASLLKLKSRWRVSSDAESLNSTLDDLGVRKSLDADMNSLSLLENIQVKTELEPNPNLIKKPGWIFYDQSDTELPDKLAKFQGIDDNLFRSASRSISKESRGLLCDCYLSREEIVRGEIGCNENCLNRLLMVECGSRCPTGERCTNKKFQRREYCPLEVFKTEKKGHGLRTRQALPSGGFVIEYVGEVLDPREFTRRVKEYSKDNQEHFYFMALKSDSIIDATQRGNCSRFINHSCEPNCETQKWTVNGELRIGFFAIKDLAPGEEITFDYQFQRYGKEAQKCFCFADSCRGWIGGDENEEENEADVEEEENEAEPEETAVVRPKVKRRPYRKRKKAAALEDMAFEEELSKLASTGLRNKNHTLTLCRLMVRAENWEARERILNILIEGDTPCRRLFLDYHGLRLIWGWMLSLPLPAADEEESLMTNDYHHKLFLKTLDSLPIPNKSMLQDSKVLSVIEKWSLAPSHSKRMLKVEPETPEAIPIKTEAPRETTEVIPIKTEAPPETLEVIPMETEAPPETSEVIPIKTEAPLEASEVIPIKTEAPLETPEVIPLKTEAPSETPEAIPVTTEAPAGSLSQLVDIIEEMPPPTIDSQTEVPSVVSVKEEIEIPPIEIAPTESVAAPIELEVLPMESVAVPKEPEVVPVESVAVPRESEAAPRESEVVPTESEAAPSEPEAAPSEPEVVPMESEAAPSEPEVVGTTALTEEVDTKAPLFEIISWEFVNGAKELLCSWAGLQEVFRIPKKERVEQMKEHEREADKGDGQRSADTVSSYDRDRGFRYRGGRIERRIPLVTDHHRTDRNRDNYYHRHSGNRGGSHAQMLTLDPNLSKEERRNLFAKKVAQKEEDEKNRRLNDEMVSLHLERCGRLGLDSTTTPIVDHSGRHYLDPLSVTWKEINLEDATLPPELHIIAQSAMYPPLMMYPYPPMEMMQPEMETPEEELFPPWPPGLPPPPPLPPTVLPKYWKMNVDDEGRCYYYDCRTRTSQWTPPSPDSEPNSESEESVEVTDDEESEGQGITTTSGDESVVSEEIEDQGQVAQKYQSWLTTRAEMRKRSGLVTERLISPRSEEEKSFFVSQKSIRENKLELAEQKGKKFADIGTADPPPEVNSFPEHRSGENHSGNLREKSMDIDEGTMVTGPPPLNVKQRREKSRVVVSKGGPGGPLAIKQPTTPESTTSIPVQVQALPDIEHLNLNECLVEESVGDEEESIPGLEETTGKETFLESPESAGLTSMMMAIHESPVTLPTVTGMTTSTEVSNLGPEKEERKRRGHKKSRHCDKGHGIPGTSAGGNRERISKSKAANIETFRSQIANVIVQHLNPYRKPSCNHGHISSTEDFKHLARKMTHAIALKEMKHSKDGKTIIVNESVKHKTKEYVKKYMARFQGKYARSPEDSQLL